MKIKPQKTAELTKLGQLIEAMSVAMLTTFDEAEGALMSRPMSPQEMCEQGAVWFLTDPSSNKVKHLQVMKGFSPSKYFKKSLKFPFNGKVKQFKGPLSIIINLWAQLSKLQLMKHFPSPHNHNPSSLCNFPLDFCFPYSAA